MVLVKFCFTFASWGMGMVWSIQFRMKLKCIKDGDFQFGTTYAVHITFPWFKKKWMSAVPQNSEKMDRECYQYLLLWGLTQVKCDFHTSVSLPYTDADGRSCQVTAQMVLVCCWRSMKEISLLLGFLCQNVPVQSVPDSKDGLLAFHQVPLQSLYKRDDVSMQRSLMLAYILTHLLKSFALNSHNPSSDCSSI